MIISRQTYRFLVPSRHTFAPDVLCKYHQLRSVWCIPFAVALLFGGTASGSAQDTAGQGEGKRFLPVSHSLSAIYWSDKLALTPYKEYLSIGKCGQWQRLVTQLLNQSFGIAGKSAKETSRLITSGIKGGLSVYGSSTLTPLAATLNNIGFALSTTADVQTDLPEAPFLILFSGDNGLKRGANLPLTHLGAQLRLYTDIAISFAEQVDAVPITEKINALFFNVTDLTHARWNLGLTISLGNAMLDLATTDGGIHLNEEGTQFFADADLKMKTAGICMNNNGTLTTPFAKGLPLAGGGAGVSGGVVLYGEHTSLGISINRIGPMFWGNVREAAISMRTRNMSAENLLEDDFDPFDPEHGGSFPDLDSGAIMHHAPMQFEWQPAWLNISTGYRFSTCSNSMHMITEYVATSLTCRQNLTPWPGHSFTPELELSAENGFVRGVVPVCLGWGLGGSKAITSSLRGGVSTRRCLLLIGYEAVGTPFWFPKNGFGVAVGVRIAWR